jgi:predicted NBD/HSP70 family sugar kinase
VGRLIEPAAIELPKEMPLPEKLEQVQRLADTGDAGALRIFETIGVWFGYSIAHFADFYDVRNLLVLGRVMSGGGGELLLATARRVLAAEFPGVAERIRFHIPDEREKRHGQAIAAASLPVIASKEVPDVPS